MINIQELIQQYQELLNMKDEVIKKYEEKIETMQKIIESDERMIKIYKDHIDRLDIHLNTSMDQTDQAVHLAEKLLLE